MTPTNLPILYQNVMFGLKSEIGRMAFLWATERPGEGELCYRAEAFAHEVECLIETITALIHIGEYQAFLQRSRPLMDLAAETDLLHYILARHANERFGGNLKPTYLNLLDGRGDA